MDLLVLNGALVYVRFRLRVVVATALSVTTKIMLPVAIVLFTDRRCLFYTLEPQPAVETNASATYCSLLDTITGR